MLQNTLNVYESDSVGKELTHILQEECGFILTSAINVKTSLVDDPYVSLFALRSPTPQFYFF
jgi:hypothetical protein